MRVFCLTDDIDRHEVHVRCNGYDGSARLWFLLLRLFSFQPFEFHRARLMFRLCRAAVFRALGSSVSGFSSIEIMADNGQHQMVPYPRQWTPTVR